MKKIFLSLLLLVSAISSLSAYTVDDIPNGYFANHSDMCDSCTNNRTDIRYLQVLLNADDRLSISLTEDGYWGTNTKNGVKAFQTEYGLSPIDGWAGSGTRNQLDVVLDRIKNNSSNPAPTISSISPSPIIASSSKQYITINGSNFSSSSIVKWGTSSGSSGTVSGGNTSYINSSKLKVYITIGSNSSTWSFKVRNSDGKESSWKDVSVQTSSSNPAPTISSISPSPIIASSSKQTISIFGNNFISTSKVIWKTSSGSTSTVSNAGTSYISSSKINIRITIPSKSKTWYFKIRNADGKESSWKSVSVIEDDEPNNSTNLSISSIAPNPIIGSTARQTISIHGEGFASNSSIVWKTSSTSFGTLSATNTHMINSSLIEGYMRITSKSHTWYFKIRNSDGSETDWKSVSIEQSDDAHRPVLHRKDNDVKSAESGNKVYFKLAGYDEDDVKNGTSQGTLHINWGDGKSSSKSLNYTLDSSTTYSHTYTSANDTTYTMKAYLKDSSGSLSRRISIPVKVGGSESTLAVSDTKYLDQKVSKDANYRCPSRGVGNSVDRATGAENFSITPLKVKGLFDLPFTLQYNSILLSGDKQISKGWSHNYNYSSTIIEIGDGVLRVYWDNSLKHYNDFKYNIDVEYYVSDEKNTQDDILKATKNSFVLTRKDGSVYTYDRIGGSGILQSISNLSEQKIDIEFDADGKLTKITEPVSGVYLAYHYDNALGKLSEVTDNTGRSATLTYDTGGLLTSIVFPDSKTSHEFHYNTQSQIDKYEILGENGNKETHFVIKYKEDGRVLHEEDGNGFVSWFLYDSSSKEGKIISTYSDKNQQKIITEYNDTNFNPYMIKHPDGTSETFTFYDNAKKKTWTDRAGNKTRYYYDADGNLNEIRYQDDSKEKFSYDENRNLIYKRVYDKSGEVASQTNNVYNDDNTLSSTSQTDGTTVEFTYNGNKQLETKTIDGKTTEYRYNTKGYIEELETPAGLLSKYTYDDAGRLKTEINPQGGMTEYTYNAIDQLISIKNPAGKISTIEYNLLGQKSVEKDFNGNVTLYGYDANGNFIVTTDALGHESHFEYDKSNRLTKSIDALGNYTQYEYDSMGRVSKTIDKNGNATTYEYDAMGNLKSQTDPYGHKLFTHTYDSKNRLIQSVNILNQKTLTDYTVFGKPSSVTDPLDRVTEFKYDKVGRLIEAINAKTISATQHYYPTGELKDFIDTNGNKTEFTYNDDGQLLTTKTASGSTQTNIYENGLLKTFKNGRNQTKSLTYDTLGRVKQAKDDDGTIAYSYDDNSNLLTITENGKTATYTYDGLNRVTSYTDIYGDTMRYDYDAVGNLERLTYPNNQDVEYSYDANGNMTEALVFGSKTTKYNYDKNNRLTKITRPNGTILTRVYNSAGQLESQTDKTASGTVISSVAFTYYDNGTIHTETRIPEVKPQLPIDLTMSYKQGNLLDTAKAKQAAFDADDNMISIGADRYTYDSRNRLTDNGATTSYGYDSQNHRISKTINGKQTTYTIDPIATLSQLLVMRESDGSKTTYIYGATGLLAQMKDGTTLYYHYDLRGSTIALTDESGNIVDRWSYLPFGGQINHDMGTTQTPFLYNGRDGVQTDPSGLYYMRARYYDPDIRRFINRDTLLGELGDMATLNRFGYVNGNPVSGVDPLGMMTWKDPFYAVGNVLGILGNGEVGVIGNAMHGAELFINDTFGTNVSLGGDAVVKYSLEGMADNLSGLGNAIGLPGGGDKAASIVNSFGENIYKGKTNDSTAVKIVNTVMLYKDVKSLGKINKLHDNSLKATLKYTKTFDVPKARIRYEALEKKRFSSLISETITTTSGAYDYIQSNAKSKHTNMCTAY